MATDAAEVVKLLKGQAKQAPIGFAFGTNAKDGELVAEKGKSGDQLMGALKKLPGIKQSCSGEVGYDGTTLRFTCDRPIQGFAKAVEGWGKANKFSFQVEVLSKQAAEKEAAAESEEDEEENKEGNALFSLDQVKQRLLQSKTKDMFFAFGVGQGKAPDLLGLHPLKSGDKLVRIVRKENSAIKRAWGKVTLQGSMATFYCEDAPFGTMKRSLRKLFKEWKLPLRVTIIGPQGEFNEEGDEEEETAEAQTRMPEMGDGAADDKAAALRRLNDALAAMLPRLKKLFAALPDQAASIRDSYAGCQAAIKAEAADEAERLLAVLQAIAGGGAGGQGGTAGDELARLRAELDKLVPSVRELAKDPARAEHARTLWTEAGDGLKSGDAVVVARAIDGLRKMIAAGGASAATQDGAAQWRRVRDAWTEANDTVGRQIGQLQGVLRATGDAELVEIAEFGLNALTRGFKAKMLAALIEIGDREPRAVPQAAGKALSAVQGLRREIASDPRVEACDRNPGGVAVSIRATLLPALDDLVDALSRAA